MKARLKLFKFKSDQLFNEYVESGSWPARCSKFLHQSLPFYLVWDGCDYTNLIHTSETMKEFNVGCVYAFNDKEETDYFLDEVCDQVTIQHIQSLQQIIKELSMKIDVMSKKLNNLTIEK